MKFNIDNNKKRDISPTILSGAYVPDKLVPKVQNMVDPTSISPSVLSGANVPDNLVPTVQI